MNYFTLSVRDAQIRKEVEAYRTRQLELISIPLILFGLLV